MESKTLINREISAGKDVVFAEHHGAQAKTIEHMAAAIQENPGQVSIVSLELPVALQTLIDDVSEGRIDKSHFVKQMHIVAVQDELDLAARMLDRGQLSQEDYDAYFDIRDEALAGLIAGEDYGLTHINEFSALYDLVQVAHKDGVQVLANDRDKERTVWSYADRLTDDRFIDGMDDTTDYDQLAVVLGSARPGVILAQRGWGHVVDLEGNNNGLDDLLERGGRDVVSIGHFSSEDTLYQVYKFVIDNGFSMPDPTDYIIVSDDVYDKEGDQLKSEPDDKPPAFENDVTPVVPAR